MQSTTKQRMQRKVMVRRVLQKDPNKTYIARAP
jgi:hypothetical protein